MEKRRGSKGKAWPKINFSSDSNTGCILGRRSIVGGMKQKKGKEKKNEKVQKGNYMWNDAQNRLGLVWYRKLSSYGH